MPNKAFFLSALLLLCVRTPAATLVVDQKSPGAADTNPGTRSRPFKTIGAAALRAKPGDTVLVRPGVYREAVHLSVSGTPGKPITFRSEAPHAAVLDGADPVTAFTPETPGVWSFPAPDIAPLGSDANAGEWIPGNVVYLDGAPLTRVTDRAGLIPGTYLLDYAAKRVLFSPYEGQGPAKERVEFTVRSGLLAAESPLNGIRIQGFTLIHNGDWFGGLHALTVCGQRWLVEDNHILWSSYAGIAFRHSNHCIVRNNLVDWSGAEGVVGTATQNLLFENNRIYHSNWQRQSPDFEGGALKTTSTYDSVYRNNEAAYFYGYGFWFDIFCGDNTYQGNTIHDNTGGGALFTEISWRTRYLDNIVYNNQFGLEVGESSECDLERNISFSNWWGANMRDDGKRKTSTTYGYVSVAEYKKDILADIPDIDPARVERLGADYQKYWVDPPNYQLAYTNFSHNLLFNNEVGYTEHRQYGVPSDLAVAIHDNQSDDNWFWSPDPSAVVGYEPGSGASGPKGYANPAEWQKLTGRDLHSVYSDPFAAGTTLPEWARANRTLWDLHLRPRPQMDALNLGLVQCPSGTEAYARISRATAVAAFDAGDPAIKAFVFDDQGRKTLALWTTDVATRRPLCLQVGQANVTQEDGYGNEKSLRPSASVVTVYVGYLPTYLHGVTDVTAAP